MKLIVKNVVGTFKGESAIRAYAVEQGVLCL